MSRALITIRGEEDRALGAKWIAKAEPGCNYLGMATSCGRTIGRFYFSMR